MNELSTGKTMTVKEVAATLGVDVSTITKRVRELFPEKVKKGVTTRLNEAEVTRLKLELQNNGHIGQLSDVVQMPKTELEKKLIVAQAMQILHEEVEALQAAVARKDKIIGEQAKALSTVSNMADWLIAGHKELGDKAIEKYGGLPWWFDK
ncbi:MAG: hypothetical protein LBS86_00795 [Treponema sp.]|jgi:DNA-binding Lrp family transcriptional regulator|nr:hypothetical protein [Treponema sp.]